MCITNLSYILRPHSHSSLVCDDRELKVLTSSSRMLLEEQKYLAQKFHKRLKVAVE